MRRVGVGGVVQEQFKPHAVVDDCASSRICDLLNRGTGSWSRSAASSTLVNMWWTSSELEGAEEVASFISEAETRYFGSPDEGFRPDWLRGVGAIPLRRQGQWAAVLYVTHRMDPRRTFGGRVMQFVSSAVYDRLGPVPGVHLAEDYQVAAGELDEYRVSSSSEPWEHPYGFVSLGAIIRMVVRYRKTAHEYAPGARMLRVDPRALDEWQRAVVGLDLALPGVTYAYFVSDVKPLAHRVRSRRRVRFGSAGCLIEHSEGACITTAAHAIDRDRSVFVKRCRNLVAESIPGRVVDHQLANPVGDEVDLSLIEIAPGSIPVDGCVTVMPGRTLELEAVNATYDGASFGDRTLVVYSTVSPLISHDGSRRWVGFITHTGDSRRVGAKGDSGSAVLRTGSDELVGHLVASPHAHGAVVQSAESEFAWLPLNPPIEIHKLRR